jgi:hypothetical protein
MTRISLLASVFAALLVARLGIADAHDDVPVARPRGAWRAELVSPHEPIPGVHISVLPGRVPGLLLENSGPEPMTVFGADGEPFLRFTEHGVEANDASPTWRRQIVARGGVAPAALGIHSAPRWRRVSGGRRFAWIEFRAWPGSDGLPSGMSSRGAPPRWAWSIPARVGDRSIEFAGLTTWRAAVRSD